MNINFLAGMNANEVYAHITENDWSTGRNEGIAKWNGERWNWLAKFGGGFDFTLGIGLRGRDLLIATVTGAVHSVTQSSEWQNDVVPYLQNELVAAGGAHPLLFDAFQISTKGVLTFVGDAGACFQFVGSKWNKLDTGSRSRLTCLLETSTKTYLFSNQGQVLAYDGLECNELLSLQDLAVSAVDLASGSEMLIAGNRRGTGILAILDLDSNSWRELVPPSPVFSVIAAQDEVFCSSAQHGVLRLSNDRFVPDLPASCSPGRVYRLGSTIVTSGGTGGPNCLFVLRDEQWTEIPINLDISFLS